MVNTWRSLLTFWKVSDFTSLAVRHRPSTMVCDDLEVMCHQINIVYLVGAQFFTFIFQFWINMDICTVLLDMLQYFRTYTQCKVIIIDSISMSLSFYCSQDQWVQCRICHEPWLPLFFTQLCSGTHELANLLGSPQPFPTLSNYLSNSDLIHTYVFVSNYDLF